MDLHIKDAARLFNVAEEVVHQWMEERGLPACTVNGKCRFNRQELLEWATVTGTRVDPELLQTDGAPDALPRITDALVAGGVLPGISGTDKEAVFAAIVQRLPLPAAVDRKFLQQVLLAREALGSTGVGDGIAIPHPRNPIVLNVTRPTVTLALLANPVDYGAPDNKPVTSLFVLISPTVRVHLHLLSRLAYILHNTDFKTALRRQARAEDILAAARHAENHIP
ncbi:MAG: hypothetical protein A3K19_16925 [Lentisphaerae bacterium RIFOXYB12_FULL_65_16]|nr:MAG: hypothetical protein A3K18_17885 [Lentisphaerae bacterium RIFOXYA12_64_32]OGV88931.1 MAG: hypothetical protein A3K19_16925 [Lentisphaerae bacterium RIFOXYB12_FULL_65_16]